MASEITVSALVQLVNGSIEHRANPAAAQLEQATVGYDSFTQSATTSYANVSYGALTTPRVFLIENDSTHAWVLVGISSADRFILRPGMVLCGELADSVTLQVKKKHANLTFTQNLGTDYTFDLPAFGYVVSSNAYEKAAVSGQAMSGTDTITADKWGIYIIQVDADGTVSTKQPSAGTAQAYETEALAIAALPTADTDNVAIAYFTIQALVGSAWTEGTDDFTEASDCQTFNFTSLIDTATISATALEE